MSIMLPINNNFSLSQNSFYNTISGTYADYFSAWDKWEKQALPGENRNEAVSLLKECLINQFSELQLNRLNLSSLPDNLPPQITVLEITQNALISLPELPASLEYLDACDNRLSTLPELPASLKHLDVDNNQLTMLPELPALLEYINADNNQLTMLPELPTSLEVLSVRNNQLTFLPELPESLEALDVSTNLLESLPAVPVRNHHSEETEIFFRCRENRITHIPENILSLDPTCTIILEDNPLSSRIRESLSQQTAQPDYHGPRIYFSMSDGQQNTLHRPLADAVTAWFPENKQSDVSQIWHAFEHEEHANTFSAFLDRLSDTVSARNTSGFREQVAAWLEKLSTSAELRQQSFAVAADATESCEDRVALTWNNLRKTL
ncbi:T3SS effector E3 ubiquitin-protein ligase IpaH3/Hc, partial [Shigella flexneri]|nr:T3SS effector E3 ubiquitin-protein ligase IpaH3 [Shigella flexneri]